ncbi:ribose 5-phosphate isomerase B [Oceanotoga sp. DSM 15011]|jgi:ribose 5-phosphate isomerase B|uniref:Ribose-5-phosphate isomerase n=1 Tax=Oceanotoga teriensis TaxID=515440 RepID=A0AA45C8H2_9BACT|nr:MULTISPECIES: ribose 5-phosphate isomerase B [Oceanotoga]MDN5342411.1 ribose 5-phosphate isomerase [Oceanotoga sp.]MDO7975508.1 ribose 5-phosphate isomerase B [Oceanotoga teriensis]PWJ96204.1 ribose-5-phosphate isomerase [Oceanotoga teriensis]UYO99987.1 ribose 5-phosphate isomerase B [Oceanotoga sp. DSM 15011]
MKIALASDHAAYDMKEYIREYLKNKNYEVIDLGTYSKESTDYPDYAKKLGEVVNKGEAKFGILMCGTGIGMSIAVNKVNGIRGALCLYPDMAKLARQHNNANVLVLGGRIMGPDLAQWTVDTFLETDFEGGRHERRVNKIKNMEE